MPREITISAFASAEMEARTVGDLRELIKWCDEHHIPDEVTIDWGTGKVYLELTGDRAVPAQWIECGDHIPPAVRFDIIVPTHEHEDEKQPAKYDWPAWDRYSDERRPE